MPEGTGDGKALIPRIFSDSLSGFVRDIFQPILTAGLIGSAVGLIFLQREVPDWLIALASTAGGFWLKGQTEKK